MFRSASLVALAIGYFLALSAWASQPTVWDDAKRESNQFIGKVISIGDDGNDMVVRIQGKSDSETFRVCSSFPGGDAINLSETERVRSLRDAFNHGNTVAVSYNSPFERCLSYVEIRKDQPQNQDADAPTPKTASSKSQKSSPSL